MRTGNLCGSRTQSMVGFTAGSKAVPSTEGSKLFSPEEPSVTKMPQPTLRTVPLIGRSSFPISEIVALSPVEMFRSCVSLKYPATHTGTVQKHCREYLAHIDLSAKTGAWQ